MDKWSTHTVVDPLVVQRKGSIIAQFAIYLVSGLDEQQLEHAKVILVKSFENKVATSNGSEILIFDPNYFGFQTGGTVHDTCQINPAFILS